MSFQALAVLRSQIDWANHDPSLLSPANSVAQDNPPSPAQDGPSLLTLESARYDFHKSGLMPLPFKTLSPKVPGGRAPTLPTKPATQALFGCFIFRFSLRRPSGDRLPSALDGSRHPLAPIWLRSPGWQSRHLYPHDRVEACPAGNRSPDSY